MTMSVSKEDFLKTLHQIVYDDHILATSSRIAERLGISGAAVTDMARKLAAEGAISYQKYKPINLTRAGRREALRIIRKHRIWETFLYNVLEIPYEALHGEAEMLEHTTSDLLLEKMDRYLGHPQFDPHGDPIPGKNGKLPSTESLKPLQECPPGKYTIARILHRNRDIGAFMTTQQVKLGNDLEVIEQVPNLRSTVIRINTTRLVLNDLITSKIYIKKA